MKIKKLTIQDEILFFEKSIVDYFLYFVNGEDSKTVYGCVIHIMLPHYQHQITISLNTKFKLEIETKPGIIKVIDRDNFEVKYFGQKQ